MKVSVITVCFNSESTIEQTIRSVLTQSYSSIEYIIIDGNSIDQTQEIIQSYQDNISRILIEEDKGIYDAMNKGVRLATGDIICILNSDDVFANDNVVRDVVNEFCSNSNLDALLTDINFVDFNDPRKRQLRYISCLRFSKWKLRFGWMPPHPGMFIKRRVCNEVGPYKLSYKIAADYEFMVRLFFTHRILYASKSICTVNMRRGGISTTGFSATNTISREIVSACVENGVYTNYCLVSLRIPIKWWTEIVSRRLHLMVKSWSNVGRLR